MSKIKIRSTALFLAFLFIGYYFSQSAFLHMHYVDGVAIMHSHPFSHQHNHTHSSAELISLDRYTHFNSLGAANAYLLPVLYSEPYSYFICFKEEAKSVVLISFLSRGPPSVLEYKYV